MLIEVTIIQIIQKTISLYKKTKFKNGNILSKCLQEERVVKWIKPNKDVEVQTEIITLYPSFIVGPVLNSLASISIRKMEVFQLFLDFICQVLRLEIAPKLT